MHFKDFLKDSAKEIDKELELYFTKWSRDVEHISPRLLPYANALADACRGGKRIRGALVKLGYMMANGERMANRNEILKVAVAFEIFQAAILAHDDIIDKSLLRRGKPSLYSQLGGDHSGVSRAICLGDIGFFLAFQLIAASDFPDKSKNNALGFFSRMMLDTGIGELLDVELGQIPPNPPLIKGGNGGFLYDDVITVYKFKTAYYSISAPLMVGGVLGGLEDYKINAIRIFGQNLGIAFQIQDDINDIFSEEKLLGKELGGDIKEGKQTLLYIYAKEHANRKQRDLLKKYYGNSEIGLPELADIKEVFKKSGALEYASSEAERYAHKATESIPEITQNEKFRKMFFEMAEYFVKK